MGRIRFALERPTDPRVQAAYDETLPAPIGGWNTVEALQSMRPQYALRLDNWIARQYHIELRGGQEDWMTGIGGDVRTLMPYTSPSVRKVFAAKATDIYDVSTGGGGAVGAAVVSGMSSGDWQYTIFTNTAGTFLTLVNGADLLQQYNGAAWSTPAVTHANLAATSDLVNIHSHKGRLWFAKKDSLRAYYLPVNNISGAATEFDLGPGFSLGGSLLAIATWTRDSGLGPDDFIVFISTEGQVIVYSGSDPAANFSLVGIYRIPKPIGKRCYTKMGGDLLILTEQGIYPLSKAIVSTEFVHKTQITYNVAPSFQAEAAFFKSSFGWQMELFTDQNLLVVNIPSTLLGDVAVQYVMNTITGAWSRLTDINALCLLTYDGKLLSGQSGKVVQLLDSVSDFSANIVGELWCAYNRLTKGGPANKHLKMLRPHLSVNGPLTLDLALLTDFNLQSVPDWQTGNVDLSTLGGSSVWNTALWDSGTWAFDDFTPLEWQTIAANPARFLAPALRVATAAVNVRLSAIDVLYDRAGLL